MRGSNSRGLSSWMDPLPVDLFRRRELDCWESIMRGSTSCARGDLLSSRTDALPAFRMLDKIDGSGKDLRSCS